MVNTAEGCAAYDGQLGALRCGSHDEDTAFDSIAMCCACGGGERPGVCSRLTLVVEDGATPLVFDGNVSAFGTDRACLVHDAPASGTL